MGLQRIRHDWATELNWTELDTFFTTDATLKKLITGREPGTQETPDMAEGPPILVPQAVMPMTQVAPMTRTSKNNKGTRQHLWEMMEGGKVPTLKYNQR